MKRRIIKQGNKSHTLTLPASWIRDENIHPGDEVSLTIEESKLIVTPGSSNVGSGEVCTLDVSGLARRSILRIVHHAYRKGYDQIIVNSINEDDTTYLNKIVRDTMIGFEVVKQEKNSIVIDNIAEPSKDKFDSVQRKIFFLIMDEADRVFTDCSKNNLQDTEGRKEVKKTIDSYTNLCRRLVIKYRINGPKMAPILMVLQSRLVLIHHAYYNLYMAKSCKKESLSRDVLAFFKEVNKSLRLFHDAYFRNDLERTNSLHSVADELYFKKLPKLLYKSNGIDSVCLFYLGEIIRLILMEANLLFGLSERL